MKFVWIEGRPVNPDQVAYVRRDHLGQTRIVFRAMPGGYDEAPFSGSVAEAVKLLEGAPAPRKPPKAR